MKKMICVLIALVFSFGLFTPTSNAASDTKTGQITSTKYDPTGGVKSVNTIYFEIKEIKGDEYYAIKKITGKVTVLEGLYRVNKITVKYAQIGVYNGIGHKEQTATNYPSLKTMSYTITPDKKWKPVRRNWALVGNNVTVDIQRGGSKWQLKQKNNVVETL
ncbi:hypothetical protein [Priestia aryabhattai]|uniref:hypothetical protein n=1 Tax=Priestia aryabhattai TaxID=412384 RepID=UPI003D2E4E57